MPLEPDDIALALQELRRLVCQDADVAREFERSRRAFFSGGEPGFEGDEARRAGRRHAEWFLLERSCVKLDLVPVEWVLARFDELGACALTQEQLRTLMSSNCSVFQVTGVAQGEGVWVRDLAATGEYPLHEPEGSHALATGDVVVGRLFAVGDALYRVSPAAGVFRSAHLLRALAKDVETLRKGRRGVLRLSQAELEAMFWRRFGGAPTDAVERARAFLAQNGVEPTDVEAVLAELARSPFDDTRIVVGARDVLGDILAGLAFETGIDLEEARRVLVEAWPALGGRAAPARANDADEKPTDVRAAIEAFDRGRSEGRDLEALFRRLEQDLDLEPEHVDPDAIDGAGAPDFPGVVGAMVEEFLWENEHEKGAQAARDCAMLRAFSEFGSDYGVFENLGRRELVLFAAVWLPERRLLRDADEARRMLRALREFCAWSQATQDVPLLDAYRAGLTELEHALPRMVDANRWCATSPAGARSEVFELLASSGASASVRDRHGDVHSVEIDARVLRALLPGDRLRAQRSDSGFTLYCCYPQQSALVAP